MKIRFRTEAGVAVLVLPQKIVGQDTPALSAAIEEAVDSGATRIVIDLTATSMLDSAALGALIYARKVYSREKYTFVLRNPQGYVRTMLENSHMNSLFLMEHAGDA